MGHRIQFALFFAACSFVMTVVTLPRLAGLRMGFPFALGLLVAVFVGLAGGSTAVYLLRGRIKKLAPASFLVAGCTAAALAQILLSLMLMGFRFDSTFSLTQLPIIGLTLVVSGVYGIVAGIALQHDAKRAGTLLGIVAAGAVAGWFFGMLTPALLGGVGSLAAASLPAFLCPLVITAGTEKRRTWTFAIISALVAIALIVQVFVPFLRIRSLGADPIVAESWTAANHIALVGEQTAGPPQDIRINGADQGWRRLAKRQPAANEGALMLPFRILKKPSFLAVGTAAAPYLSGLVANGSKGRWLDPVGLAGRIAKGEITPPPGFMTASSRLSILQVNPKAWLHENKKSSYRLVCLPLGNDTDARWIGPFFLLGDPLWTYPTVAACLNRLASGGLLMIPLPRERREGVLNTVVLCAVALRHRNVDEPAFHVFVAADQNAAVVLAKREPFTIDQASQLHDAATEANLEILYAPYRENPVGPILHALMQSNPLKALKKQGVDRRLPTDDHPRSLYDWTREQPSLPFTALFCALLGVLAFWLVPAFALRSHRLALDAVLPQAALTVLTAAIAALVLLCSLHAMRLYWSGLEILPWIAGPALLLGAGAGAWFGWRFLSASSPSPLRIVMVLLIGVALFVDRIGPIGLAIASGLREPVFGALLLIALGALIGAAAGILLARADRPQRNGLPWMFSLYAAGFGLGLTVVAILVFPAGTTITLWIGLVVLFGALWLA